MFFIPFIVHLHPPYGLQVATITYTWTRVSWFFYIGSLLLYLIFLFAYSSIPMSSGFFFVPEHMLTQAPHWLLVLLVVRWLVDASIRQR